MTRSPARNGWLKFASFLAAVALLLPLLITVLETLESPPTTTFGWIKTGLTVLAAIVAGLIYVASQRNEANNIAGLTSGRKQVMRSWRASAQGLLSANRHLTSAVGQTRVVNKRSEGHRAIREAIVSARKVVVSVFENVDEDLLTVTVGIPVQSGAAMQIVEVTPQSANRTPGTTYPFPTGQGTLHSMLRAFKQGQPVYTRDAHRTPGMQGKEYRSILSLPVMRQDRSIIAVVNVDGKNVGMFDDSVHNGPDEAAIKLVYELAQPALQVLVIALQYCEPYSREP